MRVPALAAGDVEYPRVHRQLQQLDQTSGFTAVTLWSEERPVLEEVVSVERRLPPLALLSQKKTGSR
jgi:hypothetical protein